MVETMNTKTGKEDRSVLDDWAHDRMIAVKAEERVAVRWMTLGTGIGVLGLAMCFPMNDAVMLTSSGFLRALPLVCLAIVSVFSALSIILPAVMVYGENRNIRNDLFARRFRLAVMKYMKKHSRLGITRFIAGHGMSLCINRFSENVRRALPSWFGGHGDAQARVGSIESIIESVKPLDEGKNIPREVVDLLDSVIGFREEPSDTMATRLTDTVVSRVSNASDEYRHAVEERADRHAGNLLESIANIGSNAESVQDIMTARARLNDMVQSISQNTSKRSTTSKADVSVTVAAS